MFGPGVRAKGLAWVLILAAMLPAVPNRAGAQSAGGHLEEQVAADTSQKYALYLPPGYAPDRKWPILFVLDPRGRAVLALRLFEEAAGKLGWIVMSSHNSLSDSTPEVNEKALEAMLRSAQERLSIDRSRLYLAGFSGTARAVLRFAVALRGHVAGVIAAGGALGFELGGPETVFAGDSTFAYFGAAGVRDFNHDEVVAMADRFGTMHVPFRVAVFDGAHSWPPAEICSQAIEWLELRSMRTSRRATDTAWVGERLQRDFARAADLERLGQTDKASRLYEAISRDYPLSPEVITAQARARALGNTAALQRHRARARKLAEEEKLRAEDLQSVLRWARSSSDPPTSEALIRKLRIVKLKETAERGDSLQAASAERLLARMFVWLAFYEPRSYIAKDAPHRALTMLEAANRIGPIEGESCGLLQTALHATTPDQQMRWRGHCPLD